MRYALCRWTGDGLTSKTAFRPDAPDEPFSVIDLRPDCTKVDGWCVAAFPERTSALPIKHLALDFGDESSRQGALGTIIRNIVQNRLGINLSLGDGGGIGRILADLLLPGGGRPWGTITPDGGVHRIILDGTPLFEQPVVSGGMISTDNFNRANSSTLGSPWLEDTGDLQIVSNQLQIVAGNEGIENTALYDTACGSGDMYTQVLATFVSNYGNVGVIIRSNGSGAGNDSRFELRVNQLDLHTEIIKYVTGVFSTVHTGSTGEFGTWNAGTSVTLKGTGSGSTLNIYNNGVSKWSGTDTSNQTYQYGGVWIGYINAAGDFTIDNYEQGKLVETTGQFQKMAGVSSFTPGRIMGSTVRRF